MLVILIKSNFVTVQVMERHGINMTTQKDVRPFGLRDKLGYMFGDFGNDFTFIL